MMNKRANRTMCFWSGGVAAAGAARPARRGVALMLVVVALVVLSYAMVGGILYGAYRLKGTSVLTSWVIFSVFFFTPLLVPVLSYVLTYQLVLGFHLARAALAGEFAALDRADRGPMSYLARIADDPGLAQAD